MASKNMHKQVKTYRSSKGQKGGKLFGKPVFVLDVVGRKSGESRPVVLMHVAQGNELLVVGSKRPARDTSRSGPSDGPLLHASSSKAKSATRPGRP